MMEGCAIHYWLQAWKKIVEPKLNFTVTGAMDQNGDGWSFRKFQAWLKKNSKMYGKLASRHNCTEPYYSEVYGWADRKCDSFVVVNGKYVKPPTLYKGGYNGAFWGLRRRLFEKLEIWGFEGKGLLYANRTLMGKSSLTSSAWKDKNKFRTQTIRTLKSKSAFQSWLKANARHWGTRAAKHKTSPFIVVNGRFIGGAKQFHDALQWDTCGA
jgi:hypothetical protein